MTHFSSFIAVLGLFLPFLFPVFSHGRGKSPNQSLELTAIGGGTSATLPATRPVAYLFIVRLLDLSFRANSTVQA